MLAKSQALGINIRARLEEWQCRYELLGDVRGKGPMQAFELLKDRETKKPAVEETKKLMAFCHKRGLILLSCGNLGNVIRTLIPFVIMDDQLERGLAIIEEGLVTLTRNSL